MSGVWCGWDGTCWFVRLKVRRKVNQGDKTIKHSRLAEMHAFSDSVDKTCAFGKRCY